MGRNLEKPAWKALVAAMAIAFIVVAGAGIGGSSSVSAEYSTPITSSGTRQNVTNTTISVNGYVFDILEGEPELPPDLIAQPPESGEIGSYIIHICVLITQTEIDAIRNMNITIIGSIPWNAYKVRMTPEQAQLASNLSFVDWVGFFHPAYKISGDLDPGQTDVKIIMYGPEIPDAAIEQVRLKFHTIKSEGFTLDGDYLFQGTLQSSTLINEIAANPYVDYIFNIPQGHFYDDSDNNNFLPIIIIIFMIVGTITAIIIITRKRRER